MPNTNFTSNLLKIKDLIFDNIKSSSTDIHLHFHLQRRNVSCPFCNSVTNKVHDYRHSIIKDAPIQGKFLFFAKLKMYPFRNLIIFLLFYPLMNLKEININNAWKLE